MAVSIKSLNGLGAIGKLGIDQTLVDWLSEGHYEIKLTSKEFAFFPAGSGDLPPVATVPVSLDLLQKLNGGTLPQKDKSGLAKKMTSTLEKLQSIADSGTLQKLQAGVPVDPALKAAMEKAKAEGIKAKIGEAQPAFTQPAPAPSGWPVFDQKTMFTAPLTKLRDATQLYQPVSGTSGGSRYFMVAANQDLRIGARLHGGTLSVRIEGPGVEEACHRHQGGRLREGRQCPGLRQPAPECRGRRDAGEQDVRGDPARPRGRDRNAAAEPRQDQAVRRRRC